MQQRKFVPKALPEYPVSPFESAEEAWFWFVRCQTLRNQGARFSRSDVLMARPCEPDDLYRAVISLARGGRIDKAHLGVLQRFGVADRPPDPRCREEEQASRLWDEALDRLTTVLRRKGIVREPDGRCGAAPVPPGDGGGDPPGNPATGARSGNVHV